MPNVQAHMVNGDYDLGIDCKYMLEKRGWDEGCNDTCMVQELCAKVKSFNEAGKKKKKEPSPSSPKSEEHRDYRKGLDEFSKLEKEESRLFTAPCRYEKYKQGKGGNLDRDHVHDAALGGRLDDMNNIKWLNYRVNRTVGARMKKYEPPAKIILPNCNCPN